MDTLHCDRISKSFGGTTVLINLTLQFPQTGITALIGPNGAGKTTLINLITGFQRPDAGHCFFGRRELSNIPPYQIVQLGIARTFQDLRLISQASVLENVLLARPHQKGEKVLNALLGFGVAAEEANNREEAMNLLRLVGLEKKDSELVSELSYGQQKLLAIACCLATEARVLLLDEPVSGVHPEMMYQILDVLKLLRSNNKLVVFIEHNLSVVRQIADHVVVLGQGNIIAEGDPQEILNQPNVIEAYLV